MAGDLLMQSRVLVAYRASGQRVWFRVFGSNTIVSQCIQQQDNGAAQPAAGPG